MIFDSTTQFSKAQVVTTTAASTNVIDLLASGIPYNQSSALKRDFGVGSSVPVQVQVVEAFAGATSVAVAVETDDNSGFSSATEILRTAAIPVASLKAGYAFNIDDIPTGTSEQYLRLNYVVVGTATTGKITAGVVLARQHNPL